MRESYHFALHMDCVCVCATKEKSAAQMNVSLRINQNASGNERKSMAEREGLRAHWRKKKMYQQQQQQQTRQPDSDEIAIRFDAKTLWQICNFKCTTMLIWKRFALLPIYTIIIQCVSARALGPLSFHHLSQFPLIYLYSFSHSLTRTVSGSPMILCVPRVYCTYVHLCAKKIWF